ncbi:hypothetical protein L6270_02505 [Candidatus Parcubacteria bacterium]|nr:hypothetical protein [Patescibacteria group bacterium]MBU4309529.1 hypothetical protein [Patescibacteria group bacterium]MBU4432020.1 hypothetical protein [Patescibacteria group bacterium]MBU4577235.1 hypothetical protein [Patescibacteria group bacterium]MCG2696881.1 hypothetical protein [Candidatus Parcubacteria bacterium]
MLEDINKQEEIKTAIENFSGYMLGFLDIYSEDARVVLEDYNDLLILMLTQEQGLKKSLEQALLINQEKIAHLAVIDWLKDFISQKGSAMFNDIILTDYIAHSVNCQKLNDENRRLVRKLLILYRNLKFFPASMPNDSGADWEIIPIDDKVREFSRDALSAPKTAEEKNIDVLQAQSDEYGADSLEKKVIEEEISNEKKIEGLRIMANRYPEGSLEWRALMDEVKKMQV